MGLDGQDQSGYAGIMDALRRCFPLMLLSDLAELYRGRYSGDILLTLHEGKALKAEVRNVRFYDSRRK